MPIFTSIIDGTITCSMYWDFKSDRRPFAPSKDEKKQCLDFVAVSEVY